MLSETALGPNLQEGAAADVNGDGLLDLVICDRGLNKILVMLNQGGRTFSPAISYPVADEPLGVVAGDFNGDGAVDLAVSCGRAGVVSVLLNRGDGTFQPPVSYGGIQVPAGIVSADFDGDGHLDLAVTSLTGNVVQILLGDGKGKFRDGGRFTTGAGNANRLVTDDFNGDGIPDVAVASSGTISLLFGDGAGRFGPPVLYEGYHLLDKGDFDGDGAPDLVTPGASASVGGFFLHLNRAAGNFQAPMLFPGPGDKTGGVRVGDFNGDGRPDVVAWNVDSPHLAVFLNSTPQPTPAIRSLTLDSASVIGGCESAGGTVTITAVAPPGGAVVALASSNPAIAVPAEVLIPAGAAQARFSVTTGAAATPRWASITARYNGTAQRAALLVRGGGSARLVIEPGTVIGGGGAVGQLTLPCPAGADGLVVTLTSSSASADVRPTETVPPGATTFLFPILTFKVGAVTPVTITAGVLGAAVTATLQLLPPPSPPRPPVPPPAPPALSLALFPNPVPGGLLALGQVTLPQPAGPGGALIALTSSSPAAALVPASITVLSGTSTATFPIVTFPVTGPTSVTIAAGGAFGPATAILQLLPLAAPAPVPPPVSGARVLVSSHNSNSVLRYDGQTGAFIDTFVSPNSGGLEGPHGLAIGPDGNLYVANRFHRSVLRYNGQTGAFMDAFVPPGSGGLDVPIGLVFGPDGNLYVSSYGTDEILRYDGRTGAFLGAFVPARYAGLSQPYALLFDPDGNLYVSSQGRNSVFQFDGRTGALLHEIIPPGSGGLNGPNGLAFGPDGNLYVSSWKTHSVLRYDGRTGAFLGVFVPSHSGGLTEPWGLVFGPDGNLYVASAGSDRVLRYDGRTGSFLGTLQIGGGLSRPDWLLFVPAPAVSPTTFPIHGVTYATSGSPETLTATFTQPDGGVAVASYGGYVLVRVTGVGQSYGTVYNDAFYLFTGPFDPPKNGHDGGYYQLTFGTSPLPAFCLACNAANFLVGPLPAYNPAHDYTVILNTRLSRPGPLHFGVSDGGYNDNSGAYTLTVTQLVPAP